MKTTRRNHYRILHVQPEAPAEIIAASYRTLMQKLRHHPDLGGDPDLAVLLNQAYAVLSDPLKRQRYDEELRRRGRSPASLRERDPAARRAAPSGAGGFRGAGASASATGECAWCSAPQPASVRADSRCARCDSPLSAPPALAKGKADLFGRRQSQRVARSGVVSLYLRWGEPARGGRLRDLSLSGFAVITDVALPEGQRVRISDAGMDALAMVVGCVREGRSWRIHARMTHAVFMRRTGAFVATSA